MIALGNTDKPLFVKFVDKINPRIDYTDDISEALPYNDTWIAQQELDFLNFHFKAERPKLKGMKVIDTRAE